MKSNIAYRIKKLYTQCCGAKITRSSRILNMDKRITTTIVALKGNRKLVYFHQLGNIKVIMR